MTSDESARRLIRHSSFVGRQSFYWDVATPLQPGARFHVPEPRLNDPAVQAQFRMGNGLLGVSFREHGTGGIHDEGPHVVARRDQENMVFDGPGARQKFVTAPDR